MKMTTLFCSFLWLMSSYSEPLSLMKEKVLMNGPSKSFNEINHQIRIQKLIELKIEDKTIDKNSKIQMDGWLTIQDIVQRIQSHYEKKHSVLLNAEPQENRLIFKRKSFSETFDYPEFQLRSTKTGLYKTKTSNKPIGNHLDVSRSKFNLKTIELMNTSGKHINIAFESSDKLKSVTYSTEADRPLILTPDMIQNLSDQTLLDHWQQSMEQGNQKATLVDQRQKSRKIHLDPIVHLDQLVEETRNYYRKEYGQEIDPKIDDHHFQFTIGDRLKVSLLDASCESQFSGNWERVDDTEANRVIYYPESLAAESIYYSTPRFKSTTTSLGNVIDTGITELQEDELWEQIVHRDKYGLELTTSSSARAKSLPLEGLVLIKQYLDLAESFYLNQYDLKLSKNYHTLNSKYTLSANTMPVSQKTEIVDDLSPVEVNRRSLQRLKSLTTSPATTSNNLNINKVYSGTQINRQKKSFKNRKDLYLIFTPDQFANLKTESQPKSSLEKSLLYNQVYINGPSLTLSELWQQVAERSPLKATIPFEDHLSKPLAVNGLMTIDALIEKTISYAAVTYNIHLKANIDGEKIIFSESKSLEVALLKPDLAASEAAHPAPSDDLENDLKNKALALYFPGFPLAGFQGLTLTPAISDFLEVDKKLKVEIDTFFAKENFSGTDGSFISEYDGYLFKQNISISKIFKKNRQFGIRFSHGFHNDVDLQFGDKTLGNECGCQSSTSEIDYGAADVILEFGKNYFYDNRMTKPFVQIKIPVGNDIDLMSTGSFDFSLGVVNLIPIDIYLIAAQISYTFAGDMDIFPAKANQKLEDHLNVNLGVSRPMGENKALALALNYSQNPMRKMTDISAVSDGILNATLSLEYKKISLDGSIGLSESAPDFSVGLRIKF